MRIDLSNCLVSSGPSFEIDVHRVTLNLEPNSQSPLSAPGVAEALYEEVRKLNSLTRNPNVTVTYRNTYE
jgi:hypothetical protein